jgi:LAO/AO transport system kinase
MEMADAIVINKADGENEKMAKKAKVEYQNALHLFPPAENGWYPKVQTCSALQKNGLDEVWSLIASYSNEMQQKGFFIKNRQEQNVNWMFDAVKFHLEQRFYSYESIQKAATELRREVEAGVKAPTRAALELLRLYDIK